MVIYNISRKTKHNFVPSHSLITAMLLCELFIQVQLISNMALNLYVN